MYSTHNVVTAIDNIDKLHTYLLRYNIKDLQGHIARGNTLGRLQIIGEEEELADGWDAI